MKPLALAALLATSLSPQTLLTQGERQSLLEALHNLSNAFERKIAIPELRESALECMNHVEWFEKAAARWEPRLPTDGHGLRISFQRMLRAVESLPDASSQAPQIMHDMANDLNDKQIVCKRWGLAAQPEVEVRPKKRGLTDANGLEVWYLEKFLALFPQAHPHRFPGFSSPVKDNLVPGRYLFWATDPNSQGSSGPKIEQRVAPTGFNFSVPIRIEVLAP